MKLPTQYEPNRPEEFIGTAAQVAAVLLNKLQVIRKSGKGTIKALLYGPPGVGKSAIGQMLARRNGNKFGVEVVNGRSVNVDLIRRWQEQLHYLQLDDSLTMKIVEEFDTCPPAAQDLLLTYLDEMKDVHAFIGTSNMQLDHLVPRLQSRLQAYQLKPVPTKPLAAFLRQLCPHVPTPTANMISVGSGGNVRAALLDLESWLDVKSLAH